MDQQTINDFLVANKLNANCIAVSQQGCSTIADLQIGNGFRITKFSHLLQEFMLALKAKSIPELVLKPDAGILQLEFLTEAIPTINLLDMLVASNPNTLGINVGLSFKGELMTFELNHNPHLLIGGTTGSGKSGLLHSIIANLALKPHVEIHVVDTKGIEFGFYADHNKRIQVYHSTQEFQDLLGYLNYTMEYRYWWLKNNKHFDINQMNDACPIVLVIDEFADLILQSNKDDCYVQLCKLVQKCRAANIYCVLATQRPSADILTGVIKANFSARLACKTASKLDSRMILDAGGAEQIANPGTAILNNYKYKMEKFQIAYSSIADIRQFLAQRRLHA